MFKKMIATDGKYYIKEDKNANEGLGEYVIINKIQEAKNFRMCCILFPKKVFLTGIKEKFGNNFEFQYI